jgi:hypothetical protein
MFNTKQALRISAMLVSKPLKKCTELLCLTHGTWTSKGFKRVKNKSERLFANDNNVKKLRRTVPIRTATEGHEPYELPLFYCA